MPGVKNAAAFRVGSGIGLTRVLGLVRVSVFAHYFGSGPWADAFGAALKIPNVIRNLLGEGTLSASFIPVFAGMLEKDDREGAARLAGVVVSVLAVLTALATFAGIALAPLITTLVAANFEGYTRELTIRLVRVLFPMSGMMVLSAWCLGVLNSHRKFFLSYAAPALWNVAQIGTLVALGSILATDRLVVALAWGALGGGIAQFVVQLPATIRLLGRVRLSFATTTPGVREVFVAWIPVVLGAGVMQISSVIDTQLGSFAGPGAVATLFYAQLLAIFPVSLFGISVAASELPEMSRDATAQRGETLRRRLTEGHRRIGLFVIPSAIFYAGLGDVPVGLLLQTGRFTADQTALVAAVLAAYAIGLPAQSSVKLFASGHYAMGNTRTPMGISIVSLLISGTTALLLLARFGAVGIAIGSSTGVYVNVMLNSGLLGRKLGTLFGVAVLVNHAKAAGAGFLSLGAAIVIRSLTSGTPQIAGDVASILVFGAVYAGAIVFLRHPDALAIIARRDR